MTPTGLSKSRRRDKHRPGLIISRVFKLKKHRQWTDDDETRETTYSFPGTVGIVFLAQLKGAFWGDVAPPVPQEIKLEDCYSNPRHFLLDKNNCRCVYDFKTPAQLQELINRFEAGTFSRWKRFRGVGFKKKYSRASKSIYDVAKYSAEKLSKYGNHLLEQVKSKGKRNPHFKTFYFPGVGVCVNLRNAKMACYRAFNAGCSIDNRKCFTKSSDCKAVLDIEFWAVIAIPVLKVESIVTEIIYPDKQVHNHSLDVFSISASDTYPKLRSYIEQCVSQGMGHYNTFIQVMKFAREELVPKIEQEIGRKIRKGDTRFFPTRRTVYTYWLCAAGGSVKACEDQNEIRDLLTKMEEYGVSGGELYYKFEPFDPKLLSKCYGIQLDKTFEELLVVDDIRISNSFSPDAEPQVVPVLPDEYFGNVEEHLRPSTDSSAQQRYDTAVKLLIRDCARKNIRAKASLKPGQRTGSFFLFIQTNEMATFYKHFGHKSIVFMDSGFRVNRNAFPITFISVLDNFMRGRMVGVMVSQFTDEHTYRKCLLELKRGDLSKVEPQCSMTYFDLSEIYAFKKSSYFDMHFPCDSRTE